MPSLPSRLVSAPLQASQLDEIQAFVAVSQCGSFSQAANRLGRDASTISRRIASLEARLGVRLVERTTRRVSLTESGTAYLGRMSAVLEEIAAADAHISAHRHVVQGLLRVTLPRADGRLWVAPLLPDFMARYPGLRMEVYFCDHVVDLVGEGFDVAIRLGKLPDSSLVARKVATVRRHLVASESYLNRYGRPLQPQDLATHACLGFAGHSSSSTWIFRKDNQRLELAMNEILLADDAEALLSAAAEGAGLVVTTDWMLAKHPLRERLVPLLKGWDVGEQSEVHVVTPTLRFLPAKTRVFTDTIMKGLRRDHRGMRP